MQLGVRGMSSKLWNKLTLGVEANIKNAVIISFCASIFDLLLTRIRTLLSESTTCSGDNTSTMLCPEPDNVHLRFCGVALAGLYQDRYKKMKSPKTKRKDDVSKELTVLDWIRAIDKTMLPESLKYKDEGGMYFPLTSFVPFIKSVDDSVREPANEESFKRYGPKLVEVSTCLAHLPLALSLSLSLSLSSLLLLSCHA